MCDKELLVAYLYDDLGDADRAAFETHLRGCAVCRDELAGLRGVRADLISWSPPQPDFGFRVVREPKVVPLTPRSWRAWLRPAAGLAAAAVLVLAAAASIAHVEVRRGPDGIVVRTGWGAAAPAAADAQARSAVRPAALVDPALVAALERRILALEDASRDASTDRNAIRNASAASQRASDDDLLRRMRELVAQSETKQQGELALRIGQALRDVEAQRVADLARIQQGLRGIENSVSADAAVHTQLTNILLTKQR